MLYFLPEYIRASNETYFGRSSLFISGKAAESTIAPHCPSIDLYRQEIHKYLDKWLEMTLQTVLTKISDSNITKTFLSSSNQWNEITAKQHAKLLGDDTTYDLRYLTITKNSKWVWSGNTTITNCRQPRGTARKSRSTITRYQEDKLSKAISSLFPIKMIAILEWT